MEGFGNDNQCKSVVAVGDRDVTTVDQAARLLLESFVSVDEKHSKVSFKLGSVFEAESSELCRFFAEGRHLAALKRIVEGEYIDNLLGNTRLLLLAVDEADKCPAALARVIRSVVTHTQQRGVRRLRFIFAGVSPFYESMLNEDPGVNRFVYQTITLLPMQEAEAYDLIETKFEIVCDRAERENTGLLIEPLIIDRVAALSGGHPHILQLLGSHLVESENEDPDGIIDERDMLNSLRRVCYEDRASVYRSTLHHLELYDKLDVLLTLLGMSAESPANIVSRGFPTRIDRRRARDYVDEEDIQWLVDHNILSTQVPENYGLIDEFLRIRVLLDTLESAESRNTVERKLVYDGVL